MKSMWCNFSGESSWRAIRLTLVLLSGCLLPACASLSYYAEVIDGHARILNQQHAVAELIADPQTPEELREILANFQQARAFAVTELLLPDNNSYRYYADIGREYATWLVVAAPEFSVRPRQWCFWFAGCLNYRGYFAEARAEAQAANLRAQGYDTLVAGSRAYSTLGWFADPLLNTMLYRSEALRVGILFHELAHQKLYIPDDPEFNEAFAVFIEQEGVKRWLRYRDNEALYQEYQLTLERREQFNQMLLQARAELATLYAEKLDPDLMRQHKAMRFARLQDDYVLLRASWDGYAGYDDWMAQDLNNAHVALVATYHRQSERFAALLDYLDGDLTRFYQVAEKMRDVESAQRQKWLEGIGHGDFGFVSRAVGGEFH